MIDPRVLRVATALLALADELLPKPAAPLVAGHYSASKRGPHPPGKSARWCRENFPEIPGAEKVGRDWTVSVADFNAWVAARNAKRSPVRVVRASFDLQAASTDTTPAMITMWRFIPTAIDRWSDGAWLTTWAPS